MFPEYIRYIYKQNERVTCYAPNGSFTGHGTIIGIASQPGPLSVQWIVQMDEGYRMNNCTLSEGTVTEIYSSRVFPSIYLNPLNPREDANYF